MKKIKVYVDELPEICDECPCHSVMEDRCVLLRKQAFLQSCPLINIKTHDRELVKEVCEKIHNDLKPHYGEEVSAVIIERVLSNLQKEFEK